MNEVSLAMKQRLVLPDISTFVDSKFVELFYRQFGCRPTDDDLERKIWVTPFAGACGRAGVVVVIEGTPPRGTMLVETVSS